MRTLAKKIRAQVNQMAHRQASRYALQVRDTALQELQRLAEGGMSVAELAAVLTRMEASAPTQEEAHMEGK